MKRTRTKPAGGTRSAADADTGGAVARRVVHGSGSRSGVRRPGITAADDAPSITTRIELVDAARGFAVAMMIVYHFCFDLTFYRWAAWPMLVDPRWIAWRSTIVGSFVFLVGVSLVLRDDRDRRRGTTGWFDPAFVQRWAQIGAAALLVTIGSAVLFPKTFIYFGVLHFVAVALWICRRAPRLGPSAAVLGVVALAVGIGLADPWFDPKVIDWIGFAADKPITEDYVPLFPWLGVVLVGCGVGAGWRDRGFVVHPGVDRSWRALPDPLRKLSTAMGRHSLAIYLLHQPVLLGAMALVQRVVG